MATKQLSGRVASGGFGDATTSFARAFTVIGERTGVTLVPGTLNVELNNAYALQTEDCVPAALGNQREDLYYAPCHIVARKSKQEAEAFIVRTSIQAAGRSHPLNVLEIAASKKLREALGLSDGSRVDIIVAKDVLRRR